MGTSTFGTSRSCDFCLSNHVKASCFVFPGKICFEASRCGGVPGSPVEAMTIGGKVGDEKLLVNKNCNHNLSVPMTCLPMFPYFAKLP